MLFDFKASDMINKGVEREVSTKCTTVTLEDIVDITDKMEQSLDKKRTRFPDRYKGRFHSGTPHFRDLLASVLSAVSDNDFESRTKSELKVVVTSSHGCSFRYLRNRGVCDRALMAMCQRFVASISCVGHDFS